MLLKNLLKFNQLIKKLLLNLLNKRQQLNKLKIRNKKLLNQFKIKKLIKKPQKLKLHLKLQKKSMQFSMMVNNTFISLKKIKLQLNQLIRKKLSQFKIKKLSKKPQRLKLLLKLQKKSMLYSMMVNNTFIFQKNLKKKNSNSNHNLMY